MGSRRGGRGLDPDTQLTIGLQGRSNFLASDLDVAAACAELRTLADGRRDLVGRAIGSMVGGFVGNPGTANPWQLIAAGLLAMMPFDTDEFTAGFQATYANTTVRPHGFPTGPPTSAG